MICPMCSIDVTDVSPTLHLWHHHTKSSACPCGRSTGNFLDFHEHIWEKGGDAFAHASAVMLGERAEPSRRSAFTASTTSPVRPGTVKIEEW